MIESLNLEKSISREVDKDVRLMKSDTLKNIEKSLKLGTVKIELRSFENDPSHENKLILMLEN